METPNYYKGSVYGYEAHEIIKAQNNLDDKKIK